jgi:hypothetical protein
MPDTVPKAKPNYMSCTAGYFLYISAREHSSAGRASALQAEGHRFEPYCSHHDGLKVSDYRTVITGVIYCALIAN